LVEVTAATLTMLSGFVDDFGAVLEHRVGVAGVEERRVVGQRELHDGRGGVGP
jgi:hypothetical protein